MPPREKALAAPQFSSSTPRPRKPPPSATCLKSCRRELMPDGLNLREEFPPVPTADWEATIQKDLKGGDYAKKLIWRTEEGIAVRPYYRRENLVPVQFPFGHPWREQE